MISMMKKNSQLDFLSFCDDCTEYREFTNNVCSYQFLHKESLSCKICGHVYIEHNPTCSHDCYVKHITIPCIDCHDNFLKTNVSVRC